MLVRVQRCMGLCLLDGPRIACVVPSTSCHQLHQPLPTALTFAWPRSLAGSGSTMSVDQVPWCAVASAGLQLGPAASLLEGQLEEDPCSTVSVAINLISCSSSIYSHSTDLSSSNSMHKPASTTAGLKHALEQYANTSTESYTASSVPSLYNTAYSNCIHEELPTASPATEAMPAAATGRISPDWSAVLPLKRLKLSVSTASASRPGNAAVPSTLVRSTAAISSKSLVCPPAPRRPPPSVMLVPLTELGRYAVPA